MSMKFFLLINVKMPTIVGILTFMSTKDIILSLSVFHLVVICYTIIMFLHNTIPNAVSCLVYFSLACATDITYIKLVHTLTIVVKYPFILGPDYQNKVTL